jgi:hypothetical protein
LGEDLAQQVFTLALKRWRKIRAAIFLGPACLMRRFEGVIDLPYEIKSDEEVHEMKVYTK